MTLVNLDAGAGQSVREVIDAVHRISGRGFKVEETPRRAGDPAVLVADVRRAKALLGWSAGHSALDTIVRDAWAFAEAKL